MTERLSQALAALGGDHGGGATGFSSTQSPSEIELLHGLGLRPTSVVTGTSVMHVMPMHRSFFGSAELV